MNICVFGINHKTAPIEVREKFHLNPLQQDLLLSEFKSDPAIAEALVLSTCNRTEIYLLGISSQNLTLPIIKVLTSIKKIEFKEDFKQYFYHYENKEAITHLLKVSAGLDSLVIGEKQIIGQVKTAVERAREKTMLGKYFNVLTNLAVRAGKKAQTETDISYGGSSISWAAMTMAEKLLTTLQEKSILIIGAGKMGELTLEQMKNRGVQNIYLMNRTGAAAQNLAEKHNGIAASFDDIKETLTAVDVCFCSAGAPHYILDKKIIEKVMVLRKNRTLILIDISVPRNIDPEVADVEGLHLFDIDDLGKIVDDNMRKRLAAVSVVEKIVDAKLNEYYEKLEKLKIFESTQTL